MTKGNRILLCSVMLVFIQTISNTVVVAQTDTLVDCFPLAVGNSWTYHFHYYLWLDYPVAGNHSQQDTGRVQYEVTGRAALADSVVWSFHQYRTIHRAIRDTFTPPIDSTIVDTIAFDFVESTTGAHELHRLLPDPDAIWGSVYPFQPGVPDTGRMFRYYPVGTDATTSTHLLYQTYGVQYDITLKENTGATQVRADITYVTEGAEWAQHDLIAQTILQVPDERHPALPEVFSLAQNYPNPFNPSTMITYQLPKPSAVTLGVYDLLGREVSLLVNERKEAGIHQATFDASQLSSGVYFYRLLAGSFTDTKKMLVLR